MLFQGQEFASSRPFRYFADLGLDDGSQTRAGRGNFWPSSPAWPPPPFRRVCPILPTRTPSRAASSIFRNAWRMRRFTRCTAISCGCGGMIACSLGRGAAALTVRSFGLRPLRCAIFGKADGDRLLIVNFVPICTLSPAPNRCWRRPKIVAGGCSGRAKIRLTAAPARRLWKRRRIGRFRDVRRWPGSRSTAIGFESPRPAEMPFYPRHERTHS